MKTTLPEKWYILRNEENHIKINKWFNENTIAHYTYFSKRESVCFPELNMPNAFVETKPHLGYEEISFPEFQVMVLEEFPENWNIEVGSKEQFDEVVSFLLNPNYKGAKFWEGRECGYDGGSRFIAIYTNDIGFTYNMVGYEQETRITWEQFKRLKAKQNKMERKIIGYKIIKQYPGLKKEYVGCEIMADLYKLPNGSYVGRETFNPNSEYYNPDFLKDFFLPIYEEEYKVGDWITVINPKSGWVKDIEERTFKLVETPTAFSQGLAWSTSGPNNLNVDKGRYGLLQEEFRKATPEEIEKCNFITIAGFKSEVFTKPHSDKPITKYIKFGCQEFSLEELQAYLKLFNGNINAKLTIHNVEITEKIIQKLINALN
jgi:hypothetical protein